MNFRNALAICLACFLLAMGCWRLQQGRSVPPPAHPAAPLTKHFGQIAAAIGYKLLSFTKPKPATTGYVIGLYGTDHTERALRDLVSKQADTVAVWKPGLPYTHFDAVYFANSLTPIEETNGLAILTGSPVFTVSSRSGFASRGGMAETIVFSVTPPKVVFELNEGAHRRAGISVHPILTKRARTVHR